jgi:AcrR family transcriptional regulator
MDDGGAVKRVYQSTLRQRQARSTRLAIIGAASRLFAEHGYGATSVDQIAQAADVSRATVFASVGGKPAMLKAAYDVAIVGDDEPVPLPARPRSRLIQAEPDVHRFLVLYAALVADIDRRVAGIYEAVRGAASADPAVASLWATIQRERRIGAGNVVDQVRSKAPLRADLDLVAAADIVWVLIDPWLYHQLVDQRGWPHERFEAWLAETLQAQLLPAQAGTRAE